MLAERRKNGENKISKALAKFRPAKNKGLLYL